LEHLGSVSEVGSRIPKAANSPDGVWLEIDGARFRVLSLPRLIVVKEQLNRTKDQAMLVLLRARSTNSRSVALSSQ